jgi:hypothetical protein
VAPKQIYLLASAGVIAAVALAYGLAPAASMPYLFGIPVPTPNGTHVFRAMAGLYLATAALWVAGAVRPSLWRTAVVSEVVFMLGLAMGRIVSIAVDGVPHWLFVAGAIVEVVLGLVGILLLRRPG